VAAGCLFLALVARIGVRVWGPASLMTPAAVVAFGLNPFVLDYLSAARGYSLGLMFWAAALDRLLAARDPAGWAAASDPSRPHQWASRFLALAVLSNLTFAPAAAALAACWAGWAWAERRRHGEPADRTRSWLWQNLVRPGLIVFVCLALPLVKIRPKQFYYGAADPAESLRSLVHASFAHHPQAWPFDNTADWYTGLLDVLAVTALPAVAVVLVGLGAAVALTLLRRPGTGSPAPAPGVMLFFLSTGTLGPCLGLTGIVYLFGAKLPLERTGLFLVLPFGLAVLSAGSALGAFRPPVARLSPVVTRAVLVAGVVVCFAWAVQFQTDHYRPWRYDSDSREVFQAIRDRHDPGSKRQVRLGATWALVPSMNFYRDRYEADFVERVRRLPDYPPDADYYVIAGAMPGPPPPESLVVLYHNPTTGTTLALPAGSGPPVSAELGP
jgi:hypothetical protein